MDTTELDDAYRRLLAAAEALGDPAELDAQAREAVDWTLSHLALSDRILAGAAGDVLAGRPATVDNRDAMDAGAIASLVASTTHAGRVELVRRNGAGLGAAVRAIPDSSAATPVLIRLVDRDGRPAADQRLPWRDLVRLRATRHLPGHAARLRALAPTT